MGYVHYDALVEAKACAVALPFEEGARLIDACENLFVEAIGELDELELCILLVEGRRQAYTVPAIQSLPEMGEGHPVIPDELSRRIFVRFPQQKIVSYTVLNESYGEYPKPPEEFIGRLFRTFSKSHLLDYTYATCNGTLEFESFVAHYEIACLNHVIDVVALANPEISLVLGAVNGVDPPSPRVQ